MPLQIILNRGRREFLSPVSLSGEYPKGTEIVVPTLAFSDQLTIDLGGEDLRLIRTTPSHTAGSLIVYLPSQKLLFSGDILFTDFHPFMADGDFGGWAKTLDSLLAMDVERIVPGHGPLSSKKDLREMKEYLTLFDQKAREFAATSQDVDVIAAQLLKTLPKRGMAEWMVGYNVKSRYNRCPDMCEASSIIWTMPDLMCYIQPVNIIQKENAPAM